MKIAWSNDIHLNFVDTTVAANFCARILKTKSTALLIGGDIAEAGDLVTWLRFLEENLPLPIYFVLGNHDYYGSSIAKVRDQVRRLDAERLHWLPEAGVVPLTNHACLVGHGGWGDSRHGDFVNSNLMLNDYFAIEELRTAGKEGEPCGGIHLSKAPLKKPLEALGDDAARTLEPFLVDALSRFKEVVVLTHVSPFPESCLYRGKISDPEWLPDFTCKAMGDLLRREVAAHADCQVTVLCGHTHGGGETQVLPNLRVLTGAARYGKPDFQILDI